MGCEITRPSAFEQGGFVEHPCLSVGPGGSLRLPDDDWIGLGADEHRKALAEF
jgi:hypothetical protein